MSIGKTRTPADIKKNADPRIEFIDMLAAGTGTAGIRHIKTVRRNDDLWINVKVVHFFATENTEFTEFLTTAGVNLEYDTVSFTVYCFDNLSRVTEFFAHRRNMYIHDSLVGTLVHRPQFEAQLLA